MTSVESPTTRATELQQHHEAFTINAAIGELYNFLRVLYAYYRLNLSADQLSPELRFWVETQRSRAITDSRNGVPLRIMTPDTLSRITKSLPSRFHAIVEIKRAHRGLRKSQIPLSPEIVDDTHDRLLWQQASQILTKLQQEAARMLTTVARATGNSEYDPHHGSPRMMPKWAAAMAAAGTIIPQGLITVDHWDSQGYQLKNSNDTQQRATQELINSLIASMLFPELLEKPSSSPSTNLPKLDTAPTQLEQDLQPTPVPTPVATELERIRQSIPDLQVETFIDENENIIAILKRTQSNETFSTVLFINRAGGYSTAPMDNTAELSAQPSLQEALAEIGITPEYRVTILGDDLNFRSDHSTESPAIGSFAKNASPTYISLSPDGNWVQVIASNGQRGWVATTKLVPNGGAKVEPISGGRYTIADDKTVSAEEADRLMNENAEREARLVGSFDKNSVSDWSEVFPEGTLLRLEAKKIVESYPEKNYSVDQGGGIVEHPSPTTWKVIDNNLYALDAQGNIVLEYVKHAGWSIPKTITTRSFPIRVLLSQSLQDTNRIVDLQLTDDENAHDLDGSFHQFGPSTMDENARNWANDAFGGAEYSTFPEDGKLGEQSVTEAMVYLFVMLRNGRSNEMSDISQQVKDTFKQLESGSEPLTVQVGDDIWDLRNGGVEIVVTLSYSSLGADVDKNGKLILYLNLIDHSWNTSETFANQLQAVMLNLLVRESALRDEWTDPKKYYVPEIYQRLWRYMMIDEKETRVPAIQVITRSGSSAQVK